MIASFSCPLWIAACVLTLLCAPEAAVHAQSTGDTSNFTIGGGPALLSTVSASPQHTYQTYGVSAHAQVRLHSRLSLGLAGGFFRPTDHRAQSSFTQSIFTRRVLTGTLRADLDVYRAAHVRLYSLAGLAMHHTDRSGEMTRFNDAPPHGTDTRPIAETTSRWGPQIGVGFALMRVQGAQVYMEPTLTALLPDTDDIGRFQLDIGVRLPL